MNVTEIEENWKRFNEQARSDAPDRTAGAEDRGVGAALGFNFVMAIEATGHLKEAIRLGLLANWPPGMIEVMRKDLPREGGGKARGKKAMKEWETLVGLVIHERGMECFDEVLKAAEGRMKSGSATEEGTSHEFRN